MSTTTHDLVIVGGGIAGAAIATVMARAGADVLVLEKEKAFKDRVRGEFLAPWGVRDLAELGLVEAFLEAGAIGLPALAGRSLKPRPVATPDGDPALSFSHVAVQERLLAGALEAGAKVERGARVTAITSDGTVSFDAEDGGGAAAGRLVVGADGRSSLARKASGKRERTHRAARVLAGVRLADVPADPSFGYFIIREEEGGLVSLFPQADGMARAYVFRQGNDASSYAGRDGYARFMADMVEMGVPAAALAGARQAGPLGAFVADDSWVQHPAIGALALVGDAAGISDPTWGQGIALALRDARVLTSELLRRHDWRDATGRYAQQRDCYFRTIITAEGWLDTLQLTSGAEAEARRAQVMRVWKAHPERALGLDLPGFGPALDTSEEARRRVFGEDVLSAAELPSPAAAAPSPPSPGEVAEGFVRAVQTRDFSALGGAIGENARVRALLPGGPIELHGPAEATAAFERWFGSVEDFAVIDAGSEAVADRVRMNWRFQLRWSGETFHRVVEQQAYAKVSEGRIVVMDLLCSGFRPEQAEEPAQAA